MDNDEEDEEEGQKVDDLEDLDAEYGGPLSDTTDFETIITENENEWDKRE